VVLGNVNQAVMIAESKESTAQGITLLHSRLTQYVLSSPLVVEFEDSSAAVVALEVLPKDVNAKVYRGGL
jgi:hypothetical protein